MACANLVKLNAASSSWIGQKSPFGQRSQGSSTRRLSFSIRASSYTDELIQTAKTIASPGPSIGLDNTETNRQAYRQLLLTTPGLGEYISGAILFEETLYQSTTDERSS
ncbi:hypothetical protein NC651_024531 [Populus alba x Populus x berolinensis]|nr:hypothetical protein NC651_024531 [Populus alba x Populus x berolinensis]